MLVSHKCLWRRSSVFPTFSIVLIASGFLANTSSCGLEGNTSAFSPRWWWWWFGGFVQACAIAEEQIKNRMLAGIDDLNRPRQRASSRCANFGFRDSVRTTMSTIAQSSHQKFFMTANLVHIRARALPWPRTKRMLITACTIGWRFLGEPAMVQRE